MAQFWTVKTSPEQEINVAQAMGRGEREFASGPEGEVNARYALEWAIDQLSRDESPGIENGTSPAKKG